MYQSIKVRLDDVFYVYEDTITKDADEKGKFLKVIKRLQSRWGQIGDIEDDIVGDLEGLKKNFGGSANTDERIKAVKEIHRKFEDCFDAFCKASDIKVRQMERRKVVKQGDNPKDFKILEKDAKGGDDEAQFELGIRYYKGEGIRQDCAERLLRSEGSFSSLPLSFFAKRR